MKLLHAFVLPAFVLSLFCNVLRAEPLESAKFEPGKEVKVDDPATGGAGYYMVYLPKDYSPDRTWPTIFCYHGLNQQPKTWPFKDITGGKGFIVIGMEYLDPALGKQVPAKEVANLKRIAGVLDAKIKMDKQLLFIGGFSQGGWQTVPNSDLTLDTWAGIIIMSAGRGATGKPQPALRGKAVLLTAGEKEANRSSAESGAAYYRAQGADVTLVIFPGKDHAVDTKDPQLKEWLLKHGPQKRGALLLETAKAAEKAGKLGEAHKAYSQLAAMAEAGDLAENAKKSAGVIAGKADAAQAQAESLVSEKKYAEAGKALSAIAREYAGSTWGEKATARIKEIGSDATIQASIAQGSLDARADAAEAAARALEDKRNYAAAIKAYEKYLADFPRATRAAEVKSHLAALQADKSVVGKANADTMDTECKGDFAFAEGYISNGHPEKARPLLQGIVDKYPGSDWAKKAKAKLDEIKNK